MGCYDMLPRGSQVKCWGEEMRSLKMGDAVPDWGMPEYIVLLREGGYVRVTKGVITKIVENLGRKFYYPEDFKGTPCLDKWGGTVSKREDLIGQFQGLAGMDDPYYHKS